MVEKKTTNPFFKKIYSHKKTLFLLIPLLLLTIFFASILVKTPSNDRAWSPDQAILAHANIDEETITIYNVRNNTYRSTNDYDVQHYNLTINRSEIHSLYYMVEDLPDFPGFAHTLVSFGINKDEYVAISVEIRREQEETYDPVKGLLREYELMYVIADERDVINLRANYRNNTVMLYPVNASQEVIEELLVSMLERTNKLKEEPEFYNTLTSTCTTNLVRAMNERTNTKISALHPYVLLPQHSDKLLLNRGLIQTNLTSIKEVRDAHTINEQARQHQYSQEFSRAIRE